MSFGPGPDTPYRVALEMEQQLRYPSTENIQTIDFLSYASVPAHSYEGTPCVVRVVLWSDSDPEEVAAAARHAEDIAIESFGFLTKDRSWSVSDL